MNNLISIYEEIGEVAKLIHDNGWAEKNAGNFSVRVDSDIEALSDEEIILPQCYPELSNRIFVVSGKGKRMRNIAKSPAKNTVVIKINSIGNGYNILSNERIEPTSELPTHLSIHAMILHRGSSERVVIHSHVTELIAISHIPEFCDQKRLNNLLWKMHPETIMFIPKGVGFVPFKLPGSIEIADATVESLKEHQIALWEKHGVFSIAQSLNDGFDLLDIAAKSVRIYFMCLQSGNKPQGLNDEQLKLLASIKF